MGYVVMLILSAMAFIWLCEHVEVLIIAIGFGLVCLVLIFMSHNGYKIPGTVKEPNQVKVEMLEKKVKELEERVRNNS